jgi:3-phytase
MRDTNDNVDSPALWHGPDGQHWLLATAKEGNRIIVYDAATGEKLAMFATFGDQLGQLSRPNGIAVIDDLALVVERDNHRVQVFRLPDFEALGFFGADKLVKPYGIAVDFYDGQYHLYVTDNYEMPDESIPPSELLGQRVHYFSFTLNGSEVQATHMMAFGATEGEGVLHKVESILLDRTYDRLLIADEHEAERNVKIYNLNGAFTGQIVPNYYFNYEPEGIALWSCGDNGYYIMTDQDMEVNTFQVFERNTLEYLGGFSGQMTRNTDGIALTQHSFGSFENGAFYPVHDDGSLTAISWKDIAKALSLSEKCN